MEPDKASEAPGGSGQPAAAAPRRASALWIVLPAALALVNVGFAVARVVDAVNARAGRLPRFSLLLPMWIRPEGRFTELAVVAAMPALSFLLPAAAAAIGIADLVRRRREGRSRRWAAALIALAAACLAANAVTACVIYRAVPSF